MSAQEMRDLAAQLGRPMGMMQQPFGVTMGGAGFTPTVGAARRHQRNQTAHANMVNRILADDPTARHINDTFTRILSNRRQELLERGYSYSEAYHGAMGTARVLTQQAMRTGLGDFLGGNRMDMISGASAAAGRAFLADGRGIRPGSAGNIALTEQIVSGMRGRFMTEQGGLQLNRTHGFDIGQMGQILQMGSHRGAMAGPMGQLQAQMSAMTGEVSFNPRQMERMTDEVNEFLEVTAEGLASVRDMFGPGKGIDELFSILEQVAGTPLSSTERARSAVQTVSRLRGTARVFGLDEAAFVEQTAFMGGLARHMGGISSAAITMGGGGGAARAHESMMFRRGLDNVLARSIPMDMEQMWLEHQQSVSQMSRFDDMGMHSLFLNAAQDGLLGDMTMDEARTFISSGASQSQIIAEARRRGVDLNRMAEVTDVTRAHDQLSPDDQQLIADVIVGERTTRVSERAAELMREVGIGDENSRNFIAAALENLSRSEFDQLASGDIGMIQKIFERTGDESLGDQYLQIGDPGKLVELIQQYNRAVARSDTDTQQMLLQGNLHDIREAEIAGVRASFGESGLMTDSRGFLESLAGGLLFGEEGRMDESAVLAATLGMGDMLTPNVISSRRQAVDIYRDSVHRNPEHALWSYVNARNDSVLSRAGYSLADFQEDMEQMRLEHPGVDRTEARMRLLNRVARSQSRGDDIFSKDIFSSGSDEELQKLNEVFGLNMSLTQMRDLGPDGLMMAVHQTGRVVAHDGVFTSSDVVAQQRDRFKNVTEEGAALRAMMMARSDNPEELLGMTDEQLIRKQFGASFRRGEDGVAFLAAGDENHRVTDIAAVAEEVTKTATGIVDMLRVYTSTGEFVRLSDPGELQAREALLASGEAGQMALLNQLKTKAAWLSTEMVDSEDPELLATHEELVQAIGKLEARFAGMHGREGAGGEDMRLDLHISDDSFLYIAGRVLDIFKAMPELNLVSQN